MVPRDTAAAVLMDAKDASLALIHGSWNTELEVGGRDFSADRWGSFSYSSPRARKYKYLCVW